MACNQAWHAHAGVQVICVVHGHLLLTSLHQSPGCATQRERGAGNSSAQRKRCNVPVLSLNELLLRQVSGHRVRSRPLRETAFSVNKSTRLACTRQPVCAPASGTPLPWRDTWAACGGRPASPGRDSALGPSEARSARAARTSPNGCPSCRRFISCRFVSKSSVQLASGSANAWCQPAQQRRKFVRRRTGSGAGTSEPHLLAAPPWLCHTARQPPECAIYKPGGRETPPAWGGTRERAARSPPRGAAAPANSGWPARSRDVGARDGSRAGQRPAEDGARRHRKPPGWQGRGAGGARLGARTCCKAAVSPPLSSRVGARRGRCGRGASLIGAREATITAPGRAAARGATQARCLQRACAAEEQGARGPAR